MPLGLRFNPFPALPFCLYSNDVLDFETAFRVQYDRLFVQICKDPSSIKYITGPPGSGKSTFLYHFVNYVKKEKDVDGSYLLYSHRGGVKFLYHDFLRQLQSELVDEIIALASNSSTRSSVGPLVRRAVLRGTESYDSLSAYERLFSTSAPEKICAELIDLILSLRGLRLYVICVDNIENVWPYLSDSQCTDLLRFFLYLNSMLERKVSIVTTRNPDFASEAADLIPDIESVLEVRPTVALVHDLSSAKQWIGNYLSLARLGRNSDQYAPFSDEAIQSLFEVSRTEPATMLRMARFAIEDSARNGASNIPPKQIDKLFPYESDMGADFFTYLSRIGKLAGVTLEKQPDTDVVVRDGLDVVRLRRDGTIVSATNYDIKMKYERLLSGYRRERYESVE